MRLQLPSRLATLQGVLLLAAALIGAVLAPRLGTVQADLVLPVVVGGGLRAGRTTGALLGLVGGWLVDLVPPGTGGLGLTALSYAAAGVLAGSLHGALRHSAALPAVTMLAAAGLVHVVRLLQAVLAGGAIDLVGALLSLLLTAGIGALVVPSLVAHGERLVQRGRA